jgi:hypothetical protein
MPSEVMPSFTVSYDGLYVESQVIDAAYLGTSLQGLSRLYNSSFHFWFHGEIPKRLYPEIRIHLGPPQGGSLMYLIYALMAHGQLALYPDLLWEAADMAIPPLLKAVFACRAKRNEDLAAAMGMLQVVFNQHAQFANTVHKDHVREKGRLIDIIERLTDSNSEAMREMVAPVGRSARELVHFKGTPNEIKIDEPLAEVFRSSADATVGEMTSYVARIVAVDKIFGTCKLLIEGLDKPLKGKITDPVLQQPGNIYIHALDSAAPVEITAKPVIKDGEIATLYVVDAHEPPQLSG